jgi:hypothetical protein
MYLKSLLFILLSGFSVGNKTPKADAQNTYLVNAKQFTTYFISTQIKDSIILSEQVDEGFLKKCRSSLLTDTALFSEAERQKITVELDDPLIQNWTEGVLGIKVRVIHADSIRSVFKDHHRLADWQSFYARYGKSYFTFSAPIFLRNNTLCIFYSGNNCGSNCGEGNVCLYKKVGNDWKLIKTFCNWVM